MRPWPGRGDRAGPSVAAAEGRWRRGAAPGDRWGQALAESVGKRLRAEIETVEWTDDRVDRRSNSCEKRDTTRSRLRQRNSETSKKRDRSRSVLGDRRLKRRQSRSRSGSKRRERSCTREIKRDRSGSPETRRRRSISRDRKLKKRDRRSSSNDSEKRDPSPRKHTKTTQPTPDSSATAEILSQFMTIMNYVKPTQNNTKTVPDHNVLPEFDPNNKGHAIVTWLIRVDDVAKLFGWDEKETLQYSLPKLVGDARTWYQTLTTVPFSWAEWKKTLLEQFPCPNFAELLMEMSSRHALPTETLEQYFYAKVVLLNRCGFKGRQAVDCLVQGVETDAIRLCAHAAQFAEPEELLVYLKSAESLRQIPHIVVKPPPVSETTNTTQTATTYIKTKKPIYCSFCSCEGHMSSKCPKRTPNIKQPFVKNVQMGKNQIRGPRPVYQPRMNNATIRGPRPFRPMAPGHQPGMKNKTMRGPRPLGTQPEHEYMKPVFGKMCFNCKKRGHISIDCPEPKRQPTANAVAGASQGDRESSETQPAPPGLEEE